MHHAPVDSFAVRAKQEERDELDRLVREFEARGGHIQRFAFGDTSNTDFSPKANMTVAAKKRAASAKAAEGESE